ncbi:Ectonucleoside triphosphate diphosphohydrolase 3 [Chamberlinius hualienensis]
MQIIVESRMSGLAAGQVDINVHPEDTIHNLIDRFCLDKGIVFTSNYVIRDAGDDVLVSTRTVESYGLTDGDIVYLTQPKEATLDFKIWYVIAAAVFLAALCGLIAICIFFSNNGYVPDAYGIVFDAGSTHTAMTLYSWAGGKLQNTAQPVQIYTCNMKGLLAYTNEKDLQDDLKQCLNNGKKHILNGKVSSTSLYLGATGGMRVLSIKNKTLADHIMGIVETTFYSSGYYYKTGMASIISGIEEGTDAWITTNYAENILLPTDAIISSYGALDLGGASTQFAVEIPNSVQLNSPVENFTLYGANHSVSVNSYLCFGQVQASQRYTALLTEMLKNASIVVKDPCLPKGFNFTKPVGLIFDSPCSWMDQSLRPNFTNTTNVTFSGTSNYEECQDSVQTLLDRGICLDHYKFEDCFEQEDLGSLKQHFIAMSGFYEMVEILHLQQPSFEEYFEATRELCSSSWPSMRTREITMKLVTTGAPWYCFAAVYAGKLLTYGYNYSESTWAEYLTFKNEANNIDLGWSMGFMINATNQITPESPMTYVTITTFTTLVILLVLSLILSLAFVQRSWSTSRRTRGYQRIETPVTGYGSIDSA